MISWDTVVSVVTRLQARQLRSHGSIWSRNKRYLCSPKHPDQLCCSPTLLSWSGYCKHIPRGKV